MKRSIAFLMGFLLILSMAIGASADNYLPRVVDNADLLSNTEQQNLESMIDSVIETTGMDVVILTVESLGNKTSEQYADDFFDENGYGCGKDSSGVLLLLAMNDRDWAISTCGDAIYAITDYGVESIFSEIAPFLAENRYNQAFQRFIDQVYYYYDAFLSGKPIDGTVTDYTGPGSFEVGTQEEIVYMPESFGHKLVRCFGISLLIGLIISGGNLFAQRRAMNTIRSKSQANDYIVPGSFQMVNHRDIFLYSRESRTRINNDSSGGRSGGGSSVHRSSGGVSHGGGHGKF